MSPDDFLERLKELNAAHVAGSTQLVKHFGDFVREASRAVGAGRAGGRIDPESLLSRWLDFHLATASVASTQSLALFHGLISAAENTLLPKASSPAGGKGAPTPRVELRLSGRHGERATTGFVIENHFDLPLAVTFESADLVAKSGASLPASLLSFEPATLSLEPRGQGVVQVAVAISTDFQVGETYTTTIRLLGLEAKEVGLSVTIMPSADAAGPSSRLPIAKKPARKPPTKKGVRRAS
jgi:hypothetical protein